MLTVNAAAKEGITSIATVHDSFGCLAAHAERFRKIILEQFVQMYEEHDVLSEVLKQARKDLGETGRPPLLPELPKKGNLNIKDVLKAEYAFAWSPEVIDILRGSLTKRVCAENGKSWFDLGYVTEYSVWDRDRFIDTIVVGKAACGY